MSMVTIDARVDARGLGCPMPIVRTAQAMRGLVAGQTLELLATDPGSVPDVAAWVRATHSELVEQTSDGSVYRFVIRKA
jgi:tRNA 2-thiouridine synthesizing protein A